MKGEGKALVMDPLAADLAGPEAMARAHQVSVACAGAPVTETSRAQHPTFNTQTAFDNPGLRHAVQPQKKQLYDSQSQNQLAQQEASDVQQEQEQKGRQVGRIIMRTLYFDDAGRCG
jgi:hypothetical protein